VTTDPQPEPFDPTTACHPSSLFGDGSGQCPYGTPCTLRCQIRFLDDQPQPNDLLADAEQAASWRRYYDANPGAEEASRAACDPKTYEKGTA